MSYHAYREDSTESESDEEDSTHKTNPQYESISGDSSSDPPSPSPPTDDFDYSQYLTGPGSQTASYVSVRNMMDVKLRSVDYSIY
jgi:hypothetical protein